MRDNELLELLETCIDAARDARLRYLRAEVLATTNELKRMFRLLAAEQAKHERMIREAHRFVRRDHGHRILREER